MQSSNPNINRRATGEGGIRWPREQSYVALDIYVTFGIRRYGRGGGGQKVNGVTLWILRLDKSPHEFVRGLRVEGQGVVERQEVRTLLQEGLLQTNATGMEVLLRHTQWETAVSLLEQIL